MWAQLLHFYQPSGQKRDIIDAITAQCYRPVAEGILANPQARVTLNFTGVLLDQLAEYGHQDVIDLFAEAARRGQVELVGSAKYHTILPLLEPDEAKRQIQINDETNRRYFGDAYQPKGIFLPEMAWAPELAGVISEAGFEWVMLDELAYDGHMKQVDYSKTYRVAGSELKVIFREHRLSATLMSTAVRDVAALKRAARAELRPGRYIATAMDGETFGHHRTGYEQMLFEMFRDTEINMVRVSDVFEKFAKIEAVKTVACTWASSEYDIDNGIQFISWDDPGNEIHQLQWEFIRLTVQQMKRMPANHRLYQQLREQLDAALASDQLFWAAARPWWMIEHIERGAFMLLNVLERLPNAGDEAWNQGLHLYQQIMSLAWDWQRTGKIDELTGEVHHERKQHRARIPFKELTAGQGDWEQWQAVMDLLKKEELAAVRRRDYEAAILWRDGWYKLEHKLDVYDALYIVDLFGGPVYILDKLAKAMPKGKLEATLKRYQAKFDRIRGGQVEQRSN
jgi:hypothetical protein